MGIEDPHRELVGVRQEFRPPECCNNFSFSPSLHWLRPSPSVRLCPAWRVRWRSWTLWTSSTTTSTTRPPASTSATLSELATSSLSYQQATTLTWSASSSPHATMRRPVTPVCQVQRSHQWENVWGQLLTQAGIRPSGAQLTAIPAQRLSTMLWTSSTLTQMTTTAVNISALLCQPAISGPQSKFRTLRILIISASCTDSATSMKPVQTVSTELPNSANRCHFSMGQFWLKIWI